MEGSWECRTHPFLLLEEQIVRVIGLACMSQGNSELVSTLPNILRQRNVTVCLFHLLSLHRWDPCTSIPICHHQRAQLSQGRRCHEPTEMPWAHTANYLHAEEVWPVENVYMAQSSRSHEYSIPLLHRRIQTPGHGARLHTTPPITPNP